VNVGELLHLPHVEEDLALVEAELLRSVSSKDPFLTEVASHLIKAGGKRLRPALSVASAIAGSGTDAGRGTSAAGPTSAGSATEAVIRGACAVELVHLGSLYHDDVIDEAATRRGVATVNAKWDNLVAIVSGDYLLARASELAASLGTEVAGLLAATIARLCEGEVLEIQTAFQVDRTAESYLAAIDGKTASLLSSACRIGGLCAELPRPVIDALTSYGQAFGMVFQIVDDINDLVLSEEELGKPAGDLRGGVYNLPVIHALGVPGVGDELRGLLGGPIGVPEADKARAIVRASGGIEAAVLVGRTYADAAAAVLATLAPSPVVTGLGGLGHHLLDAVPV
jgi:heptaprenyl diphosphate synthase